MNTISKISEALLGGGLNFFLVAALLGLVVAWWLIRQRTRPDISNAQSPWQSRLTEVENLFSEQSSMLYALRVTMQEQHTKVGAFRQMLSAKDATLDQLHVKLKNTEGSLTEQRAKVATLEIEQDRFRQELRVKEATLETLDGRIHALEQQLIEQGNALKEQHTKVGAFRQMLSDKDATLDQLHVKLKNTEGSLTEQRAKVATLEIEQDRFRQELRVKEATLETLDGRIHELAQQLIKQGNTLKHLETKHRSIVADKSEVEKLRGWVTELEPVAIQMQAQVLQQLQTEYQSAITDKNGEIERLRTRAAELQPLHDQIKQRDVRIRELVSSSRSLPGQEFHEPRLRDNLPKDHLKKKEDT